jgi:hypothetical protein
MERRKPLRRSGIARTATRIERAPMAPRATPLRQQSPKMRKQRRAEADLKAQLLAERGADCQAAAVVGRVACAGPLDKHEVQTRARGGDPLDPANCLLVCRAHHDWIGMHPLEALQVGLLAPG